MPSDEEDLMFPLIQGNNFLDALVEIKITNISNMFW